ncbi:hypothetical protein AN642_02495 [Epulopiscium sp. SCG-B10WGA-EpuloA2]|nr:hypothetical protein AN642_02495 [Epulopiscium sp. SCG-B10WGA-EpuloA2]
MINNDENNNQHNYQEENEDMYGNAHLNSKEQNKSSSFLKFVTGMIIFSLITGSVAGGSYALINEYLERQKPQEQLPLFQEAVDREINITPVSTIIAKPNTITQIAENVGPSIVSIINNQTIQYRIAEFQASGLGSGVIFYEDDEKIYIISNAHVVDGAETLTVTFLGNSKVNAHIIGKDTLTDIAIVGVNKDDLPLELIGKISVAPLGNSDSLRVGDLAIAIGTPLDEAYNNTVTAGIISAINRTLDVSSESEMKLIQTDAAINPGNSGGALIGPSGEVIGINTIKLVDNTVEGMGFAIPINDVKLIVDELLETGRIIRPALGITGATMTQDIVQFEFPVGVFVESVVPGSAADIGGIKANDIILEFDNTKITTMEELRALLAPKRVGDQVVVRVSRAGQNLDLNLTLTELQQSAITNEMPQQNQNPSQQMPEQQIPYQLFPFGW